MTISESTTTEIKLIDPAQLAARNHLTAIRKGEYVCPLCGNGSGKDGTGVEPANLGDHWGYHCFKCTKDFDNITVLALSYGLDARRDFVEICKRAAAEFGINLDAAQTFERKVASPPVHPSNVAAEPDPAKIELIRADIAEAQQNLNATPMKVRRGLTLETLRRFGCGYLPKWTRPSSRLDGTYCTPTPRLIVPSGDHYLARLTVPLDTYDQKAQQYIHEKEHAGNKDVPFNIADALNTNQNFICVFEGEINAMSFWQELQLPVAALGGTAFDKFIDGYTEQLKAKSKRVLILFDSDEGGRNNAEKLRAALLKNGIPAVAKFLPAGAGDWNDVLCQIRGGIAEWYENTCQNLDAEFVAAANEIIFSHLPQLKKDTPYEITNAAELAGKIFDLGFSDDRNAKRLVAAFGDRIRWCSKMQQWLTYRDGAWDFGGKGNDCIAPYAYSLSEFIAKHCTDISYLKIVDYWHSTIKSDEGITYARRIPDIRITPDDLDNHPELLNVQNGVVDLSDGKLYPHSPDLYLTQRANALYVKGYHNPDVDKFLHDIQPLDEDRAALLSYLAYCIGGDASGEIFGFFSGTGGNGKGTLTQLVQEICGDYSYEIPIEFLMVSRTVRDPNSPSPILAGLRKKRFAIANELQLGSQLDVSLLKNLTGRDWQYSRDLYEHATITAQPTAKITLSGNYLPTIIDANDIGLRRRLRMYPFTQNFTKNPDLHLKDRLLSDRGRAGMLSLIVEASVANFKRGGAANILLSNNFVEAAERYVQSNDWLGDFIDTNCEFDVDGFIRYSDFLERLRAAYPQETAKLNDQALKEIILRLDGVTKKRISASRGFGGIKFRRSK